MALKIIISEIDEENAKPKDKKQHPDWQVGWLEDEEEEDVGIVLTDHTVVNCKKIIEDMQGQNEFLSSSINAIEIKGEYLVSDPSNERVSANFLLEWFKKVS